MCNKGGQEILIVVIILSFFSKSVQKHVKMVSVIIQMVNVTLVLTTFGVPVVVKVS